MEQPNRFQKLVADVKQRITEISPEEAAKKLETGEAVLIDVRDKEEHEQARIPNAINLSRGTIELEIEEKVSDPDAVVILHCGGGGRSALAAESLQKMGYKNVRSLRGGLRAWKEAGLPTE